MKFNFGPSWIEKHNAKKDWHRWFAWCPVRVAAGDCRWLETVERKGSFTPAISMGVSGWNWKYRAIE